MVSKSLTALLNGCTMTAAATGCTITVAASMNTNLRARDVPASCCSGGASEALHHSDTTRCPLCLVEILRSTLSSHLDQCPQNVQSCPHCFAAVAVAQLHDHCVICSRNVRRCYVCHHDVPVRDLAQHLQDCGRGKCIKMYHGTSIEAARSILRTGFRPSAKGLLGAGVYVTKDPEKARNYGPVIIECEVHVGSTLVVNKKHHPLQKCWGASGYDSAWIPPQCGVVASGLEEHCIADSRRVVPLSMSCADSQLLS